LCLLFSLVLLHTFGPLSDSSAGKLEVRGDHEPAR
jgi:hypothetical protein